MYVSVAGVDSCRSLFRFVPVSNRKCPFPDTCRISGDLQLVITQFIVPKAHYLDINPGVLNIALRAVYLASAEEDLCVDKYFKKR